LMIWHTIGTQLNVIFLTERSQEKNIRAENY
jgi:hypothetical protein